MFRRVFQFQFGVPPLLQEIRSLFSNQKPYKRVLQGWRVGFNRLQNSLGPGTTLDGSWAEFELEKLSYLSSVGPKRLLKFDPKLSEF